MPTIQYAKKHLEGFWEGYLYLVANTYIAGASILLSASFVVALAFLFEISVETAAAT